MSAEDHPHVDDVHEDEQNPGDQMSCKNYDISSVSQQFPAAILMSNPSGISGYVNVSTWVRSQRYNMAAS